MNTAAPARPAQLRLLNARKDLYQVADLVELCFANSMDEDGRKYIRQMRRVAREMTYTRIAPIRLEGYVWEELGQIIGNVTLIPFSNGRQRIYLIANVAVHPGYRRRGIGRRLTQAATLYARNKGANSTWLQVRDDNPGAVQLYQSLGFVERARRATWLWEGLRPSGYHHWDSHLEIGRRSTREWLQQRDWLQSVYPQDIRWNLTLDVEKLSPGLLSWFQQQLQRQPMAHWVVRERGQLLGAASLEPAELFADSLWLACQPEREEEVLRALLAYLPRATRRQRSVTANYPSGQAEEAFFDSGFLLHNTLIWMEMPFDSTRF